MVTTVILRLDQMEGDDDAIDRLTFYLMDHGIKVTPCPAPDFTLTPEDAATTEDAWQTVLRRLRGFIGHQLEYSPHWHPGRKSQPNTMVLHPCH